jgi:hypothetical protein
VSYHSRMSLTPSCQILYVQCNFLLDLFNVLSLCCRGKNTTRPLFSIGSYFRTKKAKDFCLTKDKCLFGIYFAPPHRKIVHDTNKPQLSSICYYITENKTRYFCYETIPGTLVWSWEEMPCTVYVGIILVFMLLSLIFMTICCCMCCCNKKTENNKSNVAVNIL